MVIITISIFIIWLIKTRHIHWSMKLPYTYKVLKSWYLKGCQGTKHFLSNTFTLALIAMCFAFPLGYILWIGLQLFTWGKYPYPPTDLAILFWIPIFMLFAFRQRQRLLNASLIKIDSAKGGTEHG